MSVLLALALMAQTPPAARPAVPPDIMFLFYKVFALRERTHKFRCQAAELDRRYDAVRRRLIDYYGPSIFSPKPQPDGLAGDCGVAIVYQVNLSDLERAANAAMAPQGGN